ncbi:hypothetical protein DL95DRAFT_387983, partial [Leptodontidium sp. 2 PMI_412]
MTDLDIISCQSRERSAGPQDDRPPAVKGFKRSKISIAPPSSRKSFETVRSSNQELRRALLAVD